ncbi:MAG: hypothetical protein FWH14_08140 [Oscillospiraceae bacterium]|nr:hypothetical protein [Oscillospiraceae bacterium]
MTINNFPSFLDYTAVRPDIMRPGNLQQAPEEASDIHKLQEIGQCKTCESRKYVDVSDDPSVSFQTPQNISPAASFAAVMSHEAEHVANEKANAKLKNGEVIHQSVSYQTAQCAECGKTYMAGGETTTVVKYEKPGYNSEKGNYIDLFA